MLGLIARMDNGGLGVQTHEFYKNMKPDKTLVIDSTEFNGRKQFPQRYPNGQVVKLSQLNHTGIKTFLTGLKTLFTVEIPYDYDFFKIAKEMGIKTILNYNWEFLDYLTRSDLPLPDILLAPTVWYLNDAIQRWPMQVKQIPFPVNTKLIKPRIIEECKTFIHIAAYKLFEDRNGTQALIDALPYIKSNIKIIIYSQHPIGVIKDKRVEVREINLKNYWDLYKEGDCLILPRRYGGQSLQMQEAMAAGMIPLMPDISPQDSFLHSDMLFPTSGHKKIQTRSEIDCYDIRPEVLALSIDYMASRKVKRLNNYAIDYANSISWDNLKKKYEELCK